ncbi:MAG: chromosome segregation SMC family protein [Nanoarchaeota archaeon]
MTYIKKMVMQGFKSFAKKTEIPFDKEINLFVGPNGSGKTNIADAILFVLGRLSIKSMRAAKAKNLIFMGSKYVKPSKEAFVELVFDNSNRGFAIDNDEVHLKRIVRSNGQGIYKINEEAKTRSEVIEMLAQAGIDPYGANLIMQGQIQSIVRMHPEERRKIVEEVAGISVYEARKEKSLHELAKTDERLKEISTILRERTSYLKNLERERAEAKRYKDTELTIKRIKASILNKKSKEKEKEVLAIFNSITDKTEDKGKITVKMNSKQTKINELNIKIEEINKGIQQATGVEQDALHNETTNLKAELEGLKVRKESYENRQIEIKRRIQELSKSIPEIKKEIESLREQSPLVAKKSEELRKKKDELGKIEKERKRLFTVKTELHALRDRIKEKERQLTNVNTTGKLIVDRIEEESSNLDYEEYIKCSEAIKSFRDKLLEKRKELELIISEELSNEKIFSVADAEIANSSVIKSKIEKLDVCPLCQTKITEEHKAHVHSDVESRIKIARENKDKAVLELNNFKTKKNLLNNEINDIGKKISKWELELISHKNIKERKERLSGLVNEEATLKKEIIEIQEKIKNLENKSSELSIIEEQYENKMLDIEEVSSRTIEDIDTTLLYKERELENMGNIIKRSGEDLSDIESKIEDIFTSIDGKSEKLLVLSKKEEEMEIKFNKMFSLRDKMQKEMQEESLNLSQTREEMRQLDDQINYLRIGKAKLDAEHESVQMELSEFAGIELIQESIHVLEEKLKRSQEMMQNIGSINMRALEVYDEVKKEYDAVQEKVNTLQKEKDDIMKIIESIDNKKSKTFMKTFRAINTIFSENFSKLSTKGIAYLEIENKEDIFSAGVNIVVKLAKGKYFDVTSLSGGEQTMVALSLLFAIQEHKPYHFYVFDEIDAALDKRNSERLSALLNQYMKSGQYIVITHNDAIINNSNALYGVSMHEGISKILSLKIN